MIISCSRVLQNRSH